MDSRLNDILESLLVNIDTLNSEVMRMGRCQQFTPNNQSLQIIEHIRESCTCSLQNLRTIERELCKRMLPQDNDAKPEGSLRMESTPL